MDDRQLVQSLKAKWAETQTEWAHLNGVWKDSNAARFVQNYWNPMEKTIESFLEGLDKTVAHIADAERGISQVG